MAVLGTGATMLVATPAPVAQAADLDIPPAASSTPEPMRFTAQTLVDGGLPPFTCYINPAPPYTVPTMGSTAVNARTDACCWYDGTSTPVANMSRIIITNYLVADFTAVDFVDRQFPGLPHGSTFVSSTPCRHAEWQNQARLTVFAPPGYSPPSMTSPYYFTELNIVNCPGDAPDCAISCPGVDGAAPAVNVEPAARRED
jgi:hypothetical protein